MDARYWGTPFQRNLQANHAFFSLLGSQKWQVQQHSKILNQAESTGKGIEISVLCGMFDQA